MVKKWMLKQRAGRTFLVPANAAYPVIEVLSVIGKF
jgi:hypothetical protein